MHAVIFDADGVLFDSLSIWKNLPIQYLNNQNIEVEENILEEMEYLSMAEGVSYLKEHYQLKKDNETILLELHELLVDYYTNKVELNNPIIFALNYFKEHHIPMAIATSGDKTLVEKGLKKLQIQNYFQFVISCQDVDDSKSSSKIYEVACTKLYSKPSDTLVIEDTLPFIKTAKLAGFHTLAIQIDDSQDFINYGKYCDVIWLKNMSFSDVITKFEHIKIVNK